MGIAGGTSEIWISKSYESILLGAIQSHKMRAGWKTCHKQRAPDTLVTRELQTLPRLHQLVFVGPCENIVGVPLAAFSRARKKQRNFSFFLSYFVLSNWLSRRRHSSCCSVLGSWDCLSGDRQWGAHPLKWVEIGSFNVRCRKSQSVDGAGTYGDKEGMRTCIA